MHGRAVKVSQQIICCLALSFIGCGSGYHTEATTVAAPVAAPVDPAPTPAPAPTPTPTPTPAPAPVPTTFSADLNASSIFIGASIIQRWPLPLHNAGISGQTTSEILQRFQGTVVGHGYARVIIQGGTNDILQQVKDPPSTISANLNSMGQIAQAAGMEVVLMSVGPITSNGVNYDSTSAAANVKISQIAASQGYLYVDIFTPLQGHPEYFIDGVHPNATGYALIEKSLAAVVTK